MCTILYYRDGYDKIWAIIRTTLLTCNYTLILDFFENEY